MALRQTKIFLLILYVLCIYLLPRISDRLRAEDFLFPLMFLTLTLSTSRMAWSWAKLPLLYFGHALVVTAVCVYLDILPVKAMLIWGKEFQYFCGFLLFLDCYQGSPGFLRLFERVMLYLSIFVAVYFLFIVATGKISHYGFTYMTERDSPSLSAWLAMNTFMFCVILRYFQKYSSRKMLMLIGILFLATIGAGTRTGTGSMIFFLMIYVYLNTSLLVSLSLTSIGLVGVVVILIFRTSISSFLEMHNPVLHAAFDRGATLFELASTVESSRMRSWHEVLSMALDTNSYIFGYGRGYTHVDEYGYIASLGLGADNQYTVNFAELGMVGSAILAATLLMFWLRLRGRAQKLYTPYLLAYLMGGMTMEIFQLSKPGQLFWLITAYMICLSLEERKAVQASPKVVPYPEAKSEPLPEPLPTT